MNSVKQLSSHVLDRRPAGGRLAGILVILSFALQARARDLAPAEQRLADAVAGRREAAIDLLVRAVDINSGSLHLEGVREVGSLFGAEFESLGFATRWVDMAEVGRSGHLIATRPADPSFDEPLRVLLIGHLDTVFEPGSPFQEFEYVDADGNVSEQPTRWGKGPGTTDMKGGNVVLLEMIRALDAVGVGNRIDWAAVLIGDEERSGDPLDVARRDLREAARGRDLTLAFEDGDGDPATAVISRRGASGWELEVTGTPAHSSQIFQPAYGSGAIFETARILSAFHERLSEVENLTFNPGTIVGGTDVGYDASSARGTAFGKSNVIAQKALVHGDLRALSPQQLEQAREVMRQVVADSLPGTEATISFRDGYPPMAPTEGNRALLAELDAASRALGHGPVTAVNPRNAGAADVSFVAELVPQCLDGLGLMGTGGHTVNEVADLDTLVSQAQRVALLLYRRVAAR